MNNSDIGVRGRIKAYLKEKNISQNKFAKAIGVSPAFVNNISKGIGADKLQRISNIFTDLLGRLPLSETEEKANRFLRILKILTNNQRI